MCTGKNIDVALKQFQHCGDTQQMRLFLKKVDPCDECPEAREIEGGKESDCSCREQFRTGIKAIIRSIRS